MKKTCLAATLIVFVVGSLSAQDKDKDKGMVNVYESSAIALAKEFKDDALAAEKKYNPKPRFDPRRPGSEEPHA